MEKEISIEEIKKEYPLYSPVIANHLKDNSVVPDGTKGSVSSILDNGDLKVSWVNGSTTEVNLKEDDITKLDVVNEDDFDYRFVRIKPLKDCHKEVTWMRKEPTLTTSKTTVNFVAIVTKKQFDEFRRSLLTDRKFLDYYNELIDEVDPTYSGNPSLAVITPDDDGAILVDTEGYTYARYTAYVPDMKKELVVDYDQVYENPERTRLKESCIKALVFKPDQAPYLAMVPNTLESFQKRVGGYIETYDLSETATIICNEEGKVNNLPVNRVIGNEIINGDFLIVGINDGENFISLSAADIARYGHDFNAQPVDQPEIKEAL